MININTLEQMEEIVKANKNLYWDGWTVVKMYNLIKHEHQNTAFILKTNGACQGVLSQTGMVGIFQKD